MGITPQINSILLNLFNLSMYCAQGRLVMMWDLMSSDVGLTQAWSASFVFYLRLQEAEAFIKGDNKSSNLHHDLYLLSPLQ